MLNRRNYTRNGHDWNQMSDMESESLRGGGSYFWKGGSQKGGFGRTPEPPLVTGLDNAHLRGCETRGLLPATHRHWPKRSLSDHSQTALQTECAEIFLHTSSSGYLEQAE